MKVSIVIPVFNNYNFTKAILNDLDKLETGHETIVVDNGSSDETEVELNKRSDIIYLKNSVNSFGSGCNLGYKNSTGDYVLFLNNDVRVSKNHNNWIEALIDKAANDSIVGPTGGLLDKDFTFIKETNEYIDSKYFYISGWNILASRNVWDRLILNGCNGPFDEKTFVFYFEDPDLCYRAKELGIKLKIVPVSLVHFGKATSKKYGITELYLKSRVKFINKWVGRI